jgi:hypothetical protein
MNEHITPVCAEDRREEKSLKIITRAEARAVGLKTYFTGSACSRGHVAERAVSARLCMECSRENSQQYRKLNPESVRERVRQWRAQNKGYEGERQRRRNSEERSRGWYLYFLCHATSNVAFYVGASNRRCRFNNHLSERNMNRHKDEIIQFHTSVLGKKPIFEKIAEGIRTKELAHKLEGWMIREIGTIADGTGPLVLLGVLSAQSKTERCLGSFAQIQNSNIKEL